MSEQKISQVIVALQELLAKHGDLQVFNGDMKLGANIEAMIGEADEEGFEGFPNGYVHVGAW